MDGLMGNLSNLVSLNGLDVLAEVLSCVQNSEMVLKLSDQYGTNVRRDHCGADVRGDYLWGSCEGG